MTGKRMIQRKSVLWALSVLVHLVAIALIFFVEPVRNFVFSRKDVGELVVSERRLQEILEDMLVLNQQKAQRVLAQLSEQRDAMAVILQRQQDRLAETRGLASIQLPPAPPSPPGGGSLAQGDFMGAYEIARQAEAIIVHHYKTIRALRMAGMRRELTLQEAMDATTVMTPARADLDASAFSLPIARADDARLERFKFMLKRVDKEIASIVNYCAKLLEFAMDIDSDANWMTMNLYMEDTDLFTGGYRGPTLMPDEIYDSHSFSMGSFQPVPGRKLMGQQGEIAQWMYLDSWYIIGPFPNERRRALDTRYGPEAGVDLDASYIGKDGRELVWDYQRSFSLKIEPRVVDRYAIYYAYSEIYSDREQEVWISTGTDDYGKLWINDELIWSSGSDPKPFKADEHVQMVQLRQGFNQVLIRCENAGGTMGWCLLVCTMTE